MEDPICNKTGPSLDICSVYIKEELCEIVEKPHNNEPNMIGATPFSEPLVLQQNNELNEVTGLQEDPIKEEPFVIQTEFAGVVDTAAFLNANLKLYCEECNHEYSDYCSTCTMLIRIFNNILETTDGMPAKVIPKNIIEIKEKSDGLGVFTLKYIPKNVIFGPFSGLKVIQNTEGLAWTIENRKFVCGGSIKHNSWMQHVNCAECIWSQNMSIFQHKNELYFLSTREIAVGEELFIWFDENFVDSSNEEICYCPKSKIEFKEVYACTFCCFGFSAKEHLLRHKTKCPYYIIENKVPDFVQCTNCDIYLMKNEYLKQHAVICSKENERVLGLHPPDSEDHSAEELGGKKKYSCEICNKRFTLKGNLRQHGIYAHTGRKGRDSSSTMKPFECKVCKKRFSIKGNLNKHVYIHDVRKRFVCGTCNKGFSQKKNLKLHIRTTHADQRERELLRDQKLYQCKICKKKFTRKTTLNMHVKNIHIDIQEKDLKCTMCSYQTNYKRSLQLHIYSHSNIKLHECEICNTRFTLKTTLKSHIETKHEKKKKFQCTVCQYQTNSKGTLNRHLYTHGDEKPYHCEICNKGFIQVGKLRLHMLNRHTERKEKEFKCNRCSYQTDNKELLKRHRYTHEDKKTHYCKICNKGFAQARYLKRHLKIHTRGAKADEMEDAENI